MRGFCWSALKGSSFVCYFAGSLKNGSCANFFLKGCIKIFKVLKLKYSGPCNPISFIFSSSLLCDDVDKKDIFCKGSTPIYFFMQAVADDPPHSLSSNQIRCVCLLHNAVLSLLSHHEKAINFPRRRHVASSAKSAIVRGWRAGHLSFHLEGWQRYEKHKLLLLSSLKGKRNLSQLLIEGNNKAQ